MKTKKPRRFTLDEAKKILPQIKSITEEYAVQVEKLQKARKSAASKEEDKRFAKSMDVAVNSWAEKIVELGCEPKGLWLVDIDSGSGYFCWLRGEDDIAFFHDYEHGFIGRVAIQ